MTNPEELNRICTDHVASLLLVSTKSGMDELAREGLTSRARLVGDPMFDAFVEYSGRLKPDEIRLQLLNAEASSEIGVPAEYYYLTCHREENTADDKDLTEILRAAELLDAPVIYPVHPRNKARAVRICRQEHFSKTILCEPVGYLESACLVKHAKKIITDSGGLQREAFYAGKKCVTILDFVVWRSAIPWRRKSSKSSPRPRPSTAIIARSATATQRIASWRRSHKKQIEHESITTQRRGNHGTAIITPSRRRVRGITAHQL